MASRPSPWISGGRAYTGSEPRVQFGATNGQFSLELPGPGNLGERRQLLSGTMLILDWGGHEVGYVAFQPRFDDRYMVFYGQPVPTPPDPDNYVEAIRVPVFLSDAGLVRWLITSKIALNASKGWYDEFGYATEAQAGQLPVYEIRDSVSLSIAGRPGETFYRPVLERVGFINRPDQLGPVRVAPPLPILPSAAPPIALPPSPANDERAPAYRPVAAPPAAAPASPPPPANDLLARFRRKDG